MTNETCKLGFIGGGQMAGALLKGILAAALYRPAEIVVAEPQQSRREFLTREFGVTVVGGAADFPAACPVVVLAVKPQVMGKVLAQYRELLAGDQLLISIAAGISLSFMEECLASDTARVIRVMPNTPALVQAGASALAPGRRVESADLEVARQLLAAVGSVVVLEEKQLDAVTGLSGSGPAYVFTFLEGLVDAGVKVGLSREVAWELARQTIYGSMQLAAADKAQNPAALRAMVTSPGGTTIAGLHVLERGGFRGLLMDAVETAAKRSAELGRG
ncbi:MAG: pyrroline-5-carboxylate reductase [Desulfurivibrio sp.]|nr:pyrroline-5-carboxylate reductase [Desulfurivibrio sp.]